MIIKSIISVFSFSSSSIRASFLLLIGLSSFLFLGCEADDELQKPPLKVLSGDVFLTNQDEVDVFGEQNITVIDGNLIITETENPPILDLSPLFGLTEVIGDLTIKSAISLTSLEGLHCLEKVDGNLTLGGRGNPGFLRLYSLQDLDGLRSLRQVGGNFLLYFGAVHTLKDFNGLVSLEEVGEDLVLRNSSSPITNLDGLNRLNSIGGSLQIQIEDLENLDGLSNLNSIGKGVLISLGFNLENLSGLSQLEVIPGTLDLSGIHEMTSLSDLKNLNQIGGISLRECRNITSLDAFENLTTLQTLSIVGLERLTSIQEFANLQGSLSYLDLVSNNSLMDLNSLQGLTAVSVDLDIRENDNLRNLEGLNNINTVLNLRVKDNGALTDLCALSNLINAQGPTHLYIVSGNAYNPTIEQLQDGECYQ